MKIDWRKLFNAKGNKYTFLGYCFILGACLIIPGYFFKDRVKTKDNLRFMTSTFQGYQSGGNTKNSDLIFTIDLYGSIKIRSKYLSVLKLTEFENIPLGKKITVGVPWSDRNEIPPPAYSISTSGNVYLNYNDTLRKDKEEAELYRNWAMVAFLIGIIFFVVGYKKNETLHEDNR